MAGDKPRDQMLSQDATHVDEESFGAAVAHRPLVELLAEYQREGKVNASQVAFCLAAVQVAQPEGPLVVVPVELVELIGKTLVSRREWQAAQNRERTAFYERLNELEQRHWLGLADPVRKAHPQLSATAVAEIIVPQDVPDDVRPTIVNAVRRMIQPPPK